MQNLDDESKVLLKFIKAYEMKYQKKAFINKQATTDFCKKMCVYFNDKIADFMQSELDNANNKQMLEFDILENEKNLADIKNLLIRE